MLAHQWQTNEFVQAPGDIQDFVRAGGILDKPHRYDRRRPDGRVIEVHSVPVEGGGVLRTYTDITERKRVEERMQHVARHDGLTSLVNRAVFLEHLNGATVPTRQELARFAVHYIDLDRFKPINDTHGHAAGDRVLTEIAARIRALARDADIVARLGGDEFAVLQRGASGSSTRSAWRTASSRRSLSPSRSTASPCAWAHRSAWRCSRPTAPTPTRWCAAPTPRCTPPRPAAVTRSRGTRRLFVEESLRDSSALHEHHRRAFEVAAHALDEARGVDAIDHAVIER